MARFFDLFTIFVTTFLVLGLHAKDNGNTNYEEELALFLLSLSHFITGMWVLTRDTLYPQPDMEYNF